MTAWWSGFWLTLLFISILSSSEILHFDSGGLGLQQWNQRWVLVLVWHLNLASPAAATSGWVRVVEGQGRKSILHEPPALFSVVHRVLCVLRECVDRCLKSQKQDVEVSGRRKRRREAACSWKKEIWKSRNHATPLPHYENVCIWPVTDGRCCQARSGSHCVTVTEVWNTKFFLPLRLKPLN